MPRARLISPEFWTSEAVVDCAPMTRLLLLGLSNFADDFGVLPLRPRTIRLQVFPGDALDDEAVRAMLEELVSRGLLRRYTVEGVDYVSIVDWEIHQRVGRRARRRYAADPSLVPMETVPSDRKADQGLTDSALPPDHRDPEKDPPSALQTPSHPESAPAVDAAADAAWHQAVERAVRRAWGADVPTDITLHAARWRAEGRDLARDVLPAIERVVREAVELNRRLRLDLVDGVMADMASSAIENHRVRAVA